MITIRLEDHGQDFLEWDLDNTGKVIGCRPFQASHWTRYKVYNHLPSLKSGDILNICSKGGQPTSLNYPVETVTFHDGGKSGS